MRGVIDHFSYSQLNTYLTCPLRYRLQYVELIPPAFTASALAFGSAVHEAVAAFHHQHLLGDTLRPDQMLDVYRQTWASRNGEAIRFCNGDNEESLQEKALQMLTVYQESFDPGVEVLGIEEFFELEIARTVPPFQGYIRRYRAGSGWNRHGCGPKDCRKKALERPGRWQPPAHGLRHRCRGPGIRSRPAHTAPGCRDKNEDPRVGAL